MVSCQLPTFDNPLPPKSYHPLPLSYTKEPLSSGAMGYLPLKVTLSRSPPQITNSCPSAALVGHPSPVEPLSVDPGTESSQHNVRMVPQRKWTIDSLEAPGWRTAYFHMWAFLSLGSEHSRNCGTSTSSRLPLRDEATPCSSSIVLSSPLSSRYPIQYSSAPHRRLATLRILAYYKLSEPSLSFSSCCDRYTSRTHTESTYGILANCSRK
jgi:hypothetical protein